jgi:hypothetical protein
MTTLANPFSAAETTIRIDVAKSSSHQLSLTEIAGDTVVRRHLVAFSRGRVHREVCFRRRCSLSLMISLISAAGRISIVPQFNFTPGDWEMS